MKKSIVKSLSVFLALILILSALPMAVFATEATHSHTFYASDGGYEYQRVDDNYHKYVHYTNYDCACGEDSFRICETVEEQLPHVPKAGSALYQGSTMDSSGNIVSVYRYTCIDCGEYYYVNVYN